MADGLPHTLYSQGMQTIRLRRTVFKRHGAERSGKRSRLKRNQVRVKKLNANEPLTTCRKDNLVGKTVGFDALTGLTVTDKLFTGYRPTGIKMAGALHRLLYET
jgi:hypothetical protein